MAYKQIACYQCGKNFIPKTKKHHFCCRKCYRRFHYYNKEKKAFPFFVCPNCGTKTNLGFDPKKNYKKFEDFICPNCKHNKKGEQKDILIHSNIC